MSSLLVMTHLTCCSWLETRKGGNWEVPGHTLVAITLDSVPRINAQLRKGQPEWLFPQEWRRAALSPAQAKLGRVWIKGARLASPRGVCQALPCRCGLAGRLKGGTARS